jgi:hypothetical protein
MPYSEKVEDPRPVFFGFFGNESNEWKVNSLSAHGGENLGSLRSMRHHTITGQGPVVSGGESSEETMTNETSTTNMPDRLTVVVNRRIKPAREAEFKKMKSNN